MLLLMNVHMNEPELYFRSSLESTQFEVAMEELRRPKYREVTVELSYYTASDEGMDGKGITAAGTTATEGRTIAMSADYSLGTKVIIGGHEYTVEDRGGYIVENRVDVYVEQRETALELGRHKEIVKIKEE